MQGVQASFHQLEQDRSKEMRRFSNLELGNGSEQTGTAGRPAGRWTREDAVRGNPLVQQMRRPCLQLCQVAPLPVHGVPVPHLERRRGR